MTSQENELLEGLIKLKKDRGEQLEYYRRNETPKLDGNYMHRYYAGKIDECCFWIAEITRLINAEIKSTTMAVKVNTEITNTLDLSECDPIDESNKQEMIDWLTEQIIGMNDPNAYKNGDINRVFLEVDEQENPIDDIDTARDYLGRLLRTLKEFNLEKIIP
jgi:hypothetical protein